MKETDQKKRERKRTCMNKLPATFMSEEREREKRKQKSPI